MGMALTTALKEMYNPEIVIKKNQKKDGDAR